MADVVQEAEHDSEVENLPRRALTREVVVLVLVALGVFVWVVVRNSNDVIEQHDQVMTQPFTGPVERGRFFLSPEHPSLDVVVEFDESTWDVLPGVPVEVGAGLGTLTSQQYELPDVVSEVGDFVDGTAKVTYRLADPSQGPVMLDWRITSYGPEIRAQANTFQPSASLSFPSETTFADVLQLDVTFAPGVGDLILLGSVDGSANLDATLRVSYDGGSTGLSRSNPRLLERPKNCAEGCESAYLISRVPKPFYGFSQIDVFVEGSVAIIERQLVPTEAVWELPLSDDVLASESSASLMLRVPAERSIIDVNVDAIVIDVDGQLSVDPFLWRRDLGVGGQVDPDRQCLGFGVKLDDPTSTFFEHVEANGSLSVSATYWSLEGIPVGEFEIIPAPPVAFPGDLEECPES